MIDVGLEHAVGLLQGLLDTEHTHTGVVPVRLPGAALSRAPDALTREVFRASSGVRLLMSTRASALELDVAAYRWNVDGQKSPELPVSFDLLLDGRDHASRAVECSSDRIFSRGGDVLQESRPRLFTLRFDGLARMEKRVELWFPPNAVVELRALRADAPVDPVTDGRPRWIHYGSSISHCVAARSPTRTWPAIASRIAGVQLLNLGVGGNCHLDQFVARTIRDTPASCISVKVGINIATGDTFKFRTFGPALHGFLDTVRDGHPETPILVISPIICPALEDGPGPIVIDVDGRVARAPNAPSVPNALSLRRMREIIEETVGARAVDDSSLYYLDGIRLFGSGDVRELLDGLHPGAEGYIRIGERFARQVYSAPGCFTSLPGRTSPPAYAGAMRAR